MKKIIKATLTMGFEVHNSPFEQKNSGATGGNIPLPITIIIDLDKFKIDPRNSTQKVFLQDITRRIQTSLCISSSDINELTVQSIELKITD